MNNFKELDYLPEELEVVLTRECNFKCGYCYQNKINNFFMNTEIAKKTIDFMMSKNDNKSRAILFFGGEPLLNLKAIEIMVDRYIWHKENGNISRIIFAINTNGYLINDKFIEISKKILKHTLFKVFISLDGDKKTHNKLRVDKHGNGTFDVILNNIKKLKSAIPDIHIEIHSVISKTYIKNLEENYNFLLQNKLFNSISAELLYSDNDTDYLENNKNEDINEEDLIAYKKFYDKKVEEKNIPLKMEQFFFPILKTLNRKLICNCDVCVPACKTLDVLPNGDFIPCDYFFILEDYSKFILGNINDTNFSKMNDHIKLYRQLKRGINDKSYTLKTSNGRFCCKCEYNQSCFICLPELEIEQDGNNIIIPEKVCKNKMKIAKSFIERS